MLLKINRLISCSKFDAYGDMMDKCIYCGKLTDATEFSKEHIIPQCLGGAYAPPDFMTDRACRKCNNDLGKFVDASFEKSRPVSNWLSMSDLNLYNDQSKDGVSLVCMGLRDIPLPGMEEDEVCELWLGPWGEQVYWIRPRDENLYWYSGGNPRTVKDKRTRAYFFFSVKSEKGLRLSLLSFRDSFRRKKVDKILGSTAPGLPLKEWGFKPANDLDKDRINYLIKNKFFPDRGASFALNINFDFRFMCKLALGVGFIMFGEDYLNSDCARELQKGVWQHPDDDYPEVFGSTNWVKPESKFSAITGLESAVVLHIMQIDVNLVLVLNLGGKYCWQIKFANVHALTPMTLQGILIKGRSIVLYKFLKLGLDSSFEEFVAHKTKSKAISSITEVENIITTNRVRRGGVQ